MPRDIAGNYTLPAGNPVVPNTIIATNWANTTMQDIADALSASLSIDGSVTTAKIADDAVTPPKLAGLDVNGLVARISATEFEGRTITGTADQITVTNGGGVAGNPTLALAANVRLPGPVARVVGSGAGDANVARVDFYDSDNTTRRGYVGDASGTDDDIYLVSDTGDVVIQPATGVMRANGNSSVDLGSSSIRFQDIYAESLNFPATQVPSANANTLDDYEEGTWTPAISFTTVGNLSVTYSSQSGEYVKIGREVSVTGLITTSAFTHTTSSGDLRLTGLPFTAAFNSIGAIRINNYTFPSGGTSPVVEVTNTTSFSLVVVSSSGGTSGPLQANGHVSGDNVTIRYSATYFTS